MSLDQTGPLFHESERCELEVYANFLREELAALDAVLPAISDAQWRPSPVPTPRDDTTERTKGAHSDPTASIAIDERRLALREQIRRSEPHLRRAVVAVRGVRRGLETSLAYWGGEH